jgi:transcriptional regulator with XRE-family HTH domain
MSRGRQATELSKELGRRVKALRGKRGWKQADLSAHTGLDRGHISEIENGKRMMNLLTLQIVAKGLDTTMAKLLRGL